MLSLHNIDPCDLGFPPEFESFRECQVEAVEYVANGDKRFNGLCLPLGSGKSLCAVALARATGWRTAILSSTLGLSNQYADEFGDLVYDIRGKTNYQCQHIPSLSCRWGKHEGCIYHKTVSSSGGDQFEMADPHCTYEGRRLQAQVMPSISSNYAYWIRANQFTRGLQTDATPFELLVCDESHILLQELSRSLQVNLSETKLRDLGFDGYPHTDNLEEWMAWTTTHVTTISVQLEEATFRLKSSLRGSNLKELRERVYRLEELKEAADSITRMSRKDWVLEMHPGTKEGRKWQFDCAWPANWAEARLFCGIKKVVLMSGTLRPQTMSMVGIRKEDRSFREWPRQFPAANTPIYHVPTVRMNKDVTPEKLEVWLETIDRICRAETKLGYKGLVLTTSYERQKYIIQRSEFGPNGSNIIIANTQDPDSDSASEAADKFRKAQGPALLVSPSFGTGWDFPSEIDGVDTGCHFIIVVKLPFVNFNTKVMKARLERMPNYTAQLCMQDLVQMTGRISRSKNAWSRIYICDDSLTFFMRTNKDLAPGYFSYRKVGRLEDISIVEGRAQ